MMVPSLMSLVLCVIGFIMIWLAFDNSNVTMAVAGGLLFGGSIVIGVYHR